jgi:mannan endo-1,6-alpha-mannosidase
MRFMKGIMLRSLASVAYLAPALRETLAAGGLRDTAVAAVATCEGGEGGRECGFVWADAVEREEEGQEKIVGAPEQMNVLSALVGVLGGEVAGRGLVTEGTAGTGGGEEGGSGKGDGAGSGGEAGAGNGGGGGGSGGASMRVGMGLVLAGLFAALL